MLMSKNKFSSQQFGQHCYSVGKNPLNVLTAEELETTLSCDIAIDNPIVQSFQ